MKAPAVKAVRCAIYTRVSTDHGLDQEFNSLDAQYDAASARLMTASPRSPSPFTGTKWNGPRFFGLRDKEDRSTMEALP